MSPEAPLPGDSPPAAAVLMLLGSLAVGLLALLLGSAHRLSRPRPEPERSAQPPLQLAPAADPFALPPVMRGAPAAPAPARAPAEPRRGPRARPPITTGLVLRSPTAARVAGGRDNGLNSPTSKSDPPPASRSGDEGRPAAEASPPRRLDAGRGAAALGGSLRLEDLSPAQTSFGPSPSASPAGASGG